MRVPRVIRRRDGITEKGVRKGHCNSAVITLHSKSKSSKYLDSASQPSAAPIIGSAMISNVGRIIIVFASGKVLYTV